MNPDLTSTIAAFLIQLILHLLSFHNVNDIYFLSSSGNSKVRFIKQARNILTNKVIAKKVLRLGKHHAELWTKHLPWVFL